MLLHDRIGRGLQRVDLGLLFGRDRGACRLDVLVLLGLLPVEFRGDLDPFPTLGPERCRRLFELLPGKTVEQREIGQPALALFIEQIAEDRAAGLLVGLDADELGEAAGRRYVRLGERRTDGFGLAAPLVPVWQLLPNLLLLAVIIAEREGHQLIERHLVLAEGRDQPRAHDGEFEALPHHGRGRAEPGSDRLRPLAVIGETLEGVELVGGMHGFADDVLREARFRQRRIIGRPHVARHQVVRRDLLVLQQQSQRIEPSAADDDAEFSLWLDARGSFPGCRAPRCLPRTARPGLLPRLARVQR